MIDIQKKLMKILLLSSLVAASAFAQCGANGMLIINPLTGLWDCTGAAGAGSGTVTSIATTSPITGGTITATGTIACGTCVTSSVTQTANRILKGNGTKDTVVSGASIDSNDKGDFPGGVDLGTGSGKTGYQLFTGTTSGSVGLTVADAAGTQVLYVLPTSTGATDTVLAIDASTTCPTLSAGAPSNCRALKWSAGSGSGSIPFGPTIVPAPAVASLTWVNQGTATASNPHNLLLLQDTSNNGNIRILKKTATVVGSGFIFTALILPTVPMAFSGNPRAGICMRESGTGKVQNLVLIGNQALYGTAIAVDRWTDATNFGANILTSAAIVAFPFGTWLRMTYDGTNVISSVSGDGEFWMDINSTAKTTSFTTAPNEIGICISPSGTSLNMAESIISWIEG